MGFDGRGAVVAPPLQMEHILLIEQRVFFLSRNKNQLGPCKYTHARITQTLHKDPLKHNILKHPCPLSLAPRTCSLPAETGSTIMYGFWESKGNASKSKLNAKRERCAPYHSQP